MELQITLFKVAVYYQIICFFVSMEQQEFPFHNADDFTEHIHKLVVFDIFVTVFIVCVFVFFMFCNIINITPTIKYHFSFRLYQLRYFPIMSWPM